MASNRVIGRFMTFTSERQSKTRARRALFALLLIFTGFLGGCVYALRPYNQPSQQKVRVLSPVPQKYNLQVADTTNYPIAADGRVIIDVPQLERGCATYLFGVVKVKDGSPYDLPAIHLNIDGRTIRKLSLNELAKLPVDEEGYHLVKVD